MKNLNHSEHITIVMPVYNEQDCISDVVNSWHSFFLFHKFNFTLVIINDGSKDKTADILNSLSQQLEHIHVIHQDNSGHGPTVINGYKYAVNTQTDWIFQVDSDDQFIPQDFLKLYAKKEESDFIIGSRKKRHDPRIRLMISYFLKSIIRVLFKLNSPIQDPNIPYRLIKKNLLKAIISNIPRTTFAPNIFLSIIASKLTKNSFNIPVTHVERKTGEVSIVRLSLLKACVRSFKELLLFWSDFKLTLSFIQLDLNKESEASIQESTQSKNVSGF